MNNLYSLATCFSLILVFSSSLFMIVEAQVTPITISDSMEDVIFDGKWTFYLEWKKSAWETIETDNGLIHLRTAHQNDFVYVLLDVVPDVTPSHDDYALVCFDSTINNSSINNDGSYCFKINVDSKKPDTLLWNEEKQNFEISNNHPNLIAVGGVSDENDRYTTVPHVSYEFKIPIDLINRYDTYGFFVGVYNSETSQSDTWPKIENVDLNSDLPNPKMWGHLVSPDKSIPEYELPIMILIFTITFVILISTRRSNLKFLVDRM